MSESLHCVVAKSANKDAQKQRAKISKGACKRDSFAHLFGNVCNVTAHKGCAKFENEQFIYYVYTKDTLDER